MGRWTDNEQQRQAELEPQRQWGGSLPFSPLMHTASGPMTGPRDHHHHPVARPHGGMLHPCSVRCVPEILGSGISDMPYAPMFLNDFGKFTDILF